MKHQKKAAHQDCLSFLYEVCPEVREKYMRYWLRVEEFRDEMQKYVESGLKITPQDVRNTMVDIYMRQAASGEHEEGRPFKPGCAQMAILQLDGKSVGMPFPYVSGACKLRFLYKRCGVSGYGLSYWLSIPEFVDDMLYALYAGRRICREDVLRSMKRIYQMKTTDPDQMLGFLPRIAYRTICQMEQQIAFSEQYYKQGEMNCERQREVQSDGCADRGVHQPGDGCQ